MNPNSLARAAAASGPSECVVNDTELNMARNDVTAKDAKWERCYPEQAIQRKIDTLRAKANEVKLKVDEYQETTNKNYDTKRAALDKLADSAKELYKILFEKQKTLANLVNTRTNYEQLERRERRIFLDNDPSAGVGGAPGVRTSDDRVLLTFWITFGVAMISITLLLLELYGAQIKVDNLRSKIAVLVVAAAAAYSVAYYFISYYG